jgi:NAD(P)-dependent dehydrogenase (short-subunit alcohol dehydrogenase family)
MARDFTGKAVFITGAAHGQGRAVALAFARAGAAVAGFNIARSLAYPAYPLGSSAELETLSAEIVGSGGRFLPLVGDVRDESAVAAAVTKTVAAFGGLGIVFGNAGVAAYVFSPGVCWSGVILNLCRSEVQALQIDSYGVRPLRVLSLLAKL